MTSIPLGPVPTTDETSQVRQNTAIRQLFGVMTATLQAVAATPGVIGTGSVVLASGFVGTGSVVLAPGFTGTGSVVFATSPALVTPAIGVATGTSLAATGAITSSGGGIGYATGAGGTVTQLTDKETAVTLDKLTGRITTNNEALNTNTTTSFTLNNSFIAATDIVILSNVGATGDEGRYLLNAVPASGSATIYIRNVSGGSLSEALVIAFAVIKAVTS